MPDGSITTAKLNLVSGNVGIGTASPLQSHIFGTNIEDSAIAIENGGTGGIGGASILPIPLLHKARAS